MDGDALSDIGTSVDVISADVAVVATTVGTVEADDPTRSYTNFCVKHQSAYSNKIPAYDM